MPRRDDATGRRRSRPWFRGPAATAPLLLAAAMAAACTGGPIRHDPPPAPIAVVSSGDRIRGGQIRLGGPASCLQDAFCATGLTRVYGIDLGPGGVALDTPTATVEALAAGAVDLGAIPSSAVERTDSRIAVLSDDRQLQPADNVVPVLTAGLVNAGGNPLTSAVDQVSAALDEPGLTAIEQTLAGGAAPEVAAQGWLQSHPVVPAAAPGASPRVVIGARSDDESRALADLYAGALARGGWATSVVTTGGGRAEELDALALGRVGLVPELAAGFLEHLSAFTAVASSSVSHNIVLLRAQLADRGLVALNPAPASRRTVFAVTRAVAAALGVTTLSDLARASRARIPPVTIPPPLTASQLRTDKETPPPPTPVVLGIGSTGTPVVLLQQRLNQLGYDGSPATGTFDETTRRAVVAFQIDAGLVSDGAVTPPTARALAAAHPSERPGAAPLPGDPNSVRAPATGVAGGTGGTGGTAGTAGTVYLVFADGPSPVTPQVLDLLARSGAKATFFANQSAVVGHPETIRQITGAGDAVGVATWPHNDVSPIAQDVELRTVSATQEAVASVASTTPTCALAPYGAIDAAARARAADAGIKSVLWDVDPQDWRHPGADAIAADVINSVRPGSIVLLHDGGGDRSQTITALRTILSTLTSLGYGFAALPSC